MCIFYFLSLIFADGKLENNHGHLINPETLDGMYLPEPQNAECLLIILQFHIICPTDKTPSDKAIMSIAHIIPDTVFNVAINLGVSISKVQEFEFKPRGGMLALHHWLTGKAECRTPKTWKYLLGAITEEAGSEYAGQIKKEAQDPTWSKMQ